MDRTITVAPVRKSIVVNTDPAHAFEIFTTRINRWWPKSHGIGATPIAESIIEPFVGGRWYAKCEDGADVSVGHVLIWQPGRRVVFSWEVTAQWKPATTALSEVEVLFIAEGPGRTRVELEHRNFERMGEADGEKMRKDVDGGWPRLLALFAKAADSKSV